MALDIVGPANAPNSTTIRPADTRTFGSTDTWTKDCSSPSANDGTKIQAGFLNGTIGLLRNLIRGNGQTAGSADIITQNNADDSMALKAVQHLIQRAQPSYGVDTGAANSVVVSLTPALAEYKAGVPIRVLVAANNSGASTINVNALGTKAIVRADRTALSANDLLAGEIIELSYDGTSFQIVGLVTGAKALQGIQQFITPGTSTFTVPAGVSKIRARVWAGGGGGGAATGTTGAGAAGGAGGGYSEGIFAVTPGASLTVTVGAGGTAGTVATPAGTGGTSSVGTLLSATGGAGGAGATEGTLGGIQSSVGVGTGGQINRSGSIGTGGGNLGGNFLGGAGGGAYGTTPTGALAQSNSFGASGVGGGGGGAGLNVSGAFNGSAGFRGEVIIEW